MPAVVKTSLVFLCPEFPIEDDKVKHNPIVLNLRLTLEN